MACKRRRWRGLTPGAFFLRVVCRQPWRSRKLPAARLRPSVGPLASRYAVAGQTEQPDIIGHNRASSEHRPGISGPIRAYSGHERIVACRIVCRRSRRPVWPVACGIVCRRIAYGKVGRVRKEPVPVTPSRMARRVRYRPSPDRVP